MNEEQEKATRAFEVAQADIRKGLIGKAGAAAENRYGEAYGRLVALGLAQKLKSRFRLGVQHAV